MKKLTFKVEIEGLENKIWRKIEITDESTTVATLAYAILASFRSLAYHLYDIEYKNKFYDCWVCHEEDHRDVELVNAVVTKLSDMNLKENDTMKMNYDTGSTTTFIITYLGGSNFDDETMVGYPKVIDGAGYGMLDDYTEEELKKIIEDMDRTGKLKYYCFNIDGVSRQLYDYKIFDLESNNLHIQKYLSKIKHGYEDEYYNEM